MYLLATFRVNIFRVWYIKYARIDAFMKLFWWKDVRAMSNFIESRITIPGFQFYAPEKLDFEKYCIFTWIGWASTRWYIIWMGVFWWWICKKSL